jgi:hypothetical protein
MLPSFYFSERSEADVFCSRCMTKLPEGSQFCLKCGQKVNLAKENTALSTIPAASSCGKCGTALPRDAESCVNCGHPVAPITNSRLVPPPIAPKLAVPQRVRTRWRGRIVLGLLVLMLLGALVWAATSESPTAQQAQEFVSWSHAQTIVDTPILVKAGSFSASTFTVPPGALKVSVTGEFSAAADNVRIGKSKEIGKNPDTGIEAYVLTDDAFAVWSKGYSAQSEYESGLVPEAAVNASLPTGAGVYHLVFSNKTSRRAETVNASILLRYKSWLPDAVVRLKERFWSWIGLQGDPATL